MSCAFRDDASERQGDQHQEAAESERSDQPGLEWHWTTAPKGCFKRTSAGGRLASRQRGRGAGKLGWRMRRGIRLRRNQRSMTTCLVKIDDCRSARPNAADTVSLAREPGFLGGCRRSSVAAVYGRNASALYLSTGADQRRGSHLTRLDGRPDAFTTFWIGQRRRRLPPAARRRSPRAADRRPTRGRHARATARQPACGCSSSGRGAR